MTGKNEMGLLNDRILFPREAVTVKRGVCPTLPKSEDLPVPYFKEMRRRTRIRGLPDEYVRCGQMRRFLSFFLV